jgi:hypothetical protein
MRCSGGALGLAVLLVLSPLIALGILADMALHPSTRRTAGVGRRTLYHPQVSQCDKMPKPMAPIFNIRK